MCGSARRSILSLSLQMLSLVFGQLIGVSSIAQTRAIVVAPPAIASASVKVSVADLAPALNVSEYSTEDEKLEAVLTFVSTNQAHRFGWPSNYRSMWCPTNIFNLLKRLEQVHMDLSHASVWYILPSDKVQRGGAVDLEPHAARPTSEGPVREWSFHVVLEIDGRILDPDFTSQPHVVSAEVYAAEMWQKGPLAQAPTSEALYVRQIPAIDYLAQYAGNWDYYEAGGEGRYPAVEMNSLFTHATAVVMAKSASPAASANR